MTEQTMPNLIHIKDWGNHYSYPTLSMLRKLVFNADKNGFKKVIRKIGAKVYINEAEFFKWVEEQNAGQRYKL